MNVEHLAGLTASEAAARMISAGLSPLGNGCAAWVFAHPYCEGRIIKLVCGDEGQRAAVTLFRLNPGLEAFPEVYSFAELANGCFVVEMERLWDQPGDYDEVLRFSYPNAAGLEDTFGEDVAWLLRSVSAMVGDGIDLHRANIMLRDDGSPVIVDPFYVKASYSDRDDVRGTLERLAA